MSFATMTTRATGTGNISTTVAPDKAAHITEIRIHLSAAGGANNLTVTLDANAGSAYDVVLLTQDMTAITNLAWVPDAPFHLDSGDKIVLAWTNGSSRTYGLEVKYMY